MEHNFQRREARRQNRYARLGGGAIKCSLCSESDVRCLEQHHIPARSFDDHTYTMCGNCHSKLSDLQKDHPKRPDHPALPAEIIADFLLGIADFFELLIAQCRKYAEQLRASVAPMANAGIGS
jgi:hypothetical protein